MISKVRLILIAAGISLAAFSENAPRMAPIPADPLELVTSEIQVAATPASREAALALLARARASYALQTTGEGYDLKVAFTTNSNGQTDYDGTWEMEDVFDPQLGSLWTAKTPAGSGYAITRISSDGKLYEDGTSNTIPLRLHEVRAALFGPIPSAESIARGLIRTSTATYDGAPVTCVLLSGSRNPATATPGRRWEETEECIDPQSGLLRVHSQVPGRYFAYDYTNALQLGGHVLPSKVTITEAGKVVSEISVSSLSALPAADPSRFVPTAEMKANGRANTLAEAQKLFRVAQGPLAPGMTVQPVCVFGLVTPAGQLVEAHSLQPSDPNSQKAVEAAKLIHFSAPAPLGAPPQQHFVFVIEEFAVSQ